MGLRYLVSGESAITLEVGNEISEKINLRVRQLNIAIDKAQITGITELIPTYRSIKIDYNPSKIKYNVLVKKLEILEKQLSDIDIDKPKVIEIPVLYQGPDLKYVSEYNNI